MYTTRELYKAHTESLEDDVDFYFDFCQEKQTLELFAGFGRVTNKLIAKGCDIETVELDPFMAVFIDLPEHKNHIGDVREFTSGKRFDRIFAAYNSFPLLTDDEDIRLFFSSMSELLDVGGKLALNVYHPNWWENAVDYPLTIGDGTVRYSSGYNLERRYTDKIAQWHDHYDLPDGDRQTISHTIRLYENSADFTPYLKGVELRHIDTVINYNRPEHELVEPGWVDFIFQKQG